MVTDARTSRLATIRPLLTILVGMVVLAGAGVLVWRENQPAAVLPPAVVAASANLQAPASEASAGRAATNVVPEPAKPSFDVVRIAPDGSAVIAGRAVPGAQVTVRDGEREIGQAKTDARGEFVLLPTAPLPSGGRELTLSARDGAGAEVKADNSVLLMIPANPPGFTGAASGALAVLKPAAGPAVPLQVPAAVAQAEPRSVQRLGLDVVEYDDAGNIRFGGTAPSSAPVRIYVDDAPVGDATAGTDARWGLTPKGAVAAGMHRVRVDQLTQQGRVVARVELPFQRVTLPPAAVAQGQVVVQPGQNLWRLARRVYGAGMQYTVIFQANREQIRDPRMIFPGQAFAIPASVAR